MNGRAAALIVGAIGVAHAKNQIFDDCGVTEGNELVDETKCNQGLCFQKFSKLDAGVETYNQCEKQDEGEIKNVSYERHQVDEHGDKVADGGMAQNPMYLAVAWTDDTDVTNKNVYEDGRVGVTDDNKFYPNIATCSGPMEVTNGKFGVQIAFFDIKNMFCTIKGNQSMRHPIDTEITQEKGVFDTEEWSDKKGGKAGKIKVPKAVENDTWDDASVWAEHVIDLSDEDGRINKRAQEFARYQYFAKKVCQGRRAYRTIKEEAADLTPYNQYQWFCGCNEQENEDHPDGLKSRPDNGMKKYYGHLASCNPDGGNQWMCREQESKINYQNNNAKEYKWSCVDNPYTR